MKDTIKTLEARLAGELSPRDQIDTLNALAWAISGSDTPRALALIAEAQALLDSLTLPDVHPRGAADLLRNRAQVKHLEGEYGEAIKLAGKAVATYEMLGDIAGQAECLHVIGTCYNRLGDYAAALSMRVQEVRLREKLEDWEGLATALNGIGVVCWFTKDYDKMLQYLRRAEAIYLRIGDKDGEGIINNNLCHFLQEMGRLEEALDHGVKALACFETTGDVSGLSRANANVGGVYMKQEAFEQAAVHFARAYDYALQTGRKYPQLIVLYDLGRLCLVQHDYARAADHLQQALELATATHDKHFIYRTHEELSKVYKAQGNFEQALRYFEMFHAYKEEVLNEESAAKLQNLEVLHRTQDAEREAQILRQLREQDRVYFERLSQMKDEFLSTASHDLKNPLATMVNTVFLLKHHGLTRDEKGAHFVEVLERQLRRMQSLITDILDLAQLETGRALVTDRVSLKHLLHEVVHEFEASAQHKQIRLQYRADIADLYVDCDPSRIRQALDNLVSNALKYTENGGQVELIVEQSSVEVTVRVVDTGLGIPPDDVPHIFDRFYRVKEGKHRDVEGTGLGLAIVKSIVEQHQGRIWVESHVGQGSVFSFTLPLPQAV